MSTRSPEALTASLVAARASLYLKGLTTQSCFTPRAFTTRLMGTCSPGYPGGTRLTPGWG